MASPFGDTPVAQAPAAASPFGDTPTQSTPQAQSKDFSPSEILKQYLPQVNPVNMVKGAAQMAAHPIEAAESYGQQNQDIWNKAKDSFQSGNYGQAARHAFSYFLQAIPGLGAALDKAGDKAGSGDVNGAIADTAALATMIGGPKVAPLIPGAIAQTAVEGANAAGRLATAAKIAAPDVAAGAAKVAAGAALGEILPEGPLRYAAAAAPGYAGARQVMKGIGAGIKGSSPEAQAAQGLAEIPEATAPVDPLMDLKDQIAQGYKYKNFAAVKDPAVQDTINTIADRMSQPKAAPAPAQAAPEPAPQIVPPPQAPPMAGAQPQGMPQPAAPQPLAQPQPKPVMRIPAVPAGTPQLQTPSTPTAPEGPITWEASKDPDIARKLDAGATRLMPDGSTEVLREVPFRDENGVQQIHQDVDPDTGQANQVYEPTVQRYMKDGWAVQPQLRLSTDAEKPGFIVNDGHHRIEAADRLGRNSILAWTPEEAPASPEDAAAERIKNVIQMPSPTQANPMEGLSPEMQKAAADANYRGIKEGAEGAEPVALYKGAAQANKATKLAQQLYDSQIGHADLSQLSPAKLRQHLGDMTKAMGINKTGQISDDSVGNVLFELKKLEAKNKPKLVK